VGEVSPWPQASSAFGLRGLGAHPLMGAAGCRHFQDSYIRWAHPRRASKANFRKCKKAKKSVIASEARQSPLIPYKNARFAYAATPVELYAVVVVVLHGACPEPCRGVRNDRPRF
jgi:hypothetical protein